MVPHGNHHLPTPPTPIDQLLLSFFLLSSSMPFVSFSTDRQLLIDSLRFSLSWLLLFSSLRSVTNFILFIYHFPIVDWVFLFANIYFLSFSTTESIGWLWWWSKKQNTEHTSQTHIDTVDLFPSLPTFVFLLFTANPKLRSLVIIITTYHCLSLLLFLKQNSQVVSFYFLFEKNLMSIQSDLTSFLLSLFPVRHLSGLVQFPLFSICKLTYSVSTFNGKLICS